MRERSEMILADLIQIRAEEKPDLDVLTFEHLSLDGGATPDEVRSYADFATNGNRLAAALVARFLPDIPAWPQLPQRSFREGMVAQYSEGFPGIVAGEEKVFVDTGKDLDAIRKDTDRDYFMSGLEAKEYGIVDHVITDREDLERIDKMEA